MCLILLLSNIVFFLLWREAEGSNLSKDIRNTWNSIKSFFNNLVSK